MKPTRFPTSTMVPGAGTTVSGTCIIEQVIMCNLSPLGLPYDILFAETSEIDVGLTRGFVLPGQTEIVRIGLKLNEDQSIEVNSGQPSGVLSSDEYPTLTITGWE